jgi:hypothetical protein
VRPEYKNGCNFRATTSQTPVNKSVGYIMDVVCVIEVVDCMHVIDPALFVYAVFHWSAASTD